MATLENTSMLVPLACFPGEDLSVHDLAELRRIGLHTLRRERNWGVPQPKIYGTIGSFHCGDILAFICQILGTEYIIVSARHGIVECRNTNTSSIAAHVDIGGAIFHLSLAHYTNDGVSVGLLVGNTRRVLFWRMEGSSILI